MMGRDRGAKESQGIQQWVRWQHEMGFTEGEHDGRKYNERQVGGRW